MKNEFSNSQLVLVVKKKKKSSETERQGPKEEFFLKIKNFPAKVENVKNENLRARMPIIKN